MLLSGSDSLYALALHLGMLGWDFDVLEPPELREAVAVLGGGSPEPPYPEAMGYLLIFLLVAARGRVRDLPAQREAA